MKTLITGGCGFIGSHIAEALVSEGQDVRIFDNLSSGYLHNLEPFRDKVEFIEGDVRDSAAVAAAMQGVTQVFHEAALVSVFESVEKPQDNHDINLTGTLNVLTAARDAGAKRLVVASSAAVYGNDPALPKREAMLPQPESPYALAKITKEYYLSVFSKLYGLETVSLRYFNVYGPRQDPGSMYSGVISKFSEVIRAGQDPTVFGDGEQTRDFVFVKDVVQANLLAMRGTAATSGSVFNIGTGQRTSLLELLNALRDLTGNDFRVAFKEERAGDIRHSVADISAAVSTLGYTPGFTIHDGLRALLESMT